MTNVIDRSELAPLVSPSSDKSVPVQRWFLYPHSFSKSLVQLIMDHAIIDRGHRVLDPFAGAGSTLVACRERQVSAHGLDVLPISTWACNVKVQVYDLKELQTTAYDLLKRIAQPTTLDDYGHDNGLGRYLGPNTTKEFYSIYRAINTLGDEVQHFFQLALIRNTFAASNVIRDGGWLRWKNDYIDRPESLRESFASSINLMMKDVSDVGWSENEECFATEGDARISQPPDGDYQLIVGSPPYLNRHDYTRILAVELLAQCVDDMEGLKPFRYRTLRSHVEARPPENDIDATEYSATLRTVITELDQREPEARIRKMILGYFADLTLVFANIKKYIAHEGFVSLVVSDARFNGVIIPVRKILDEIAICNGFAQDVEWVLRWRGNSSQQMGTYGRDPVAESVLIWRMH